MRSAILVATVVQLGAGLRGSLADRLPAADRTIDWHDPRVKQVFILMLPVTIGLGIVNLDQLINSAFGSLVSEEAPRAIDNAFRVYMLPQGVFSVAVATVLFPTLSRMASSRDAGAMRRAVGNGMRQINLLLIPSAAFMIVLSTPIVRLLFERGQFNSESTRLVSIALFWFAWSLPFAGLNLLLTRTFFAVQRPWIPTRLAAMNIVVDIIVSVALYKPLGIAGPGDRDGRGQRGHDGPAAAAPARGPQRPPGRWPDDDDHGQDHGRLGAAGGRLLGGLEAPLHAAGRLAGGADRQPRRRPGRPASTSTAVPSLRCTSPRHTRYRACCGRRLGRP